MIVTHLAHITEQAALTPRLQKAIAFLQQAHGEKFKAGRVELEKHKVYALAQTYETHTPASICFEAHRKYIDVQYIASGLEEIAWAPIERLRSLTAYDESNDVWFGVVPPDEVTSVRLAAGQVAVFYPADAHAPRQAVGQPTAVNKIVVKVILE